jgi:hypothetical protein
VTGIEDLQEIERLTAPDLVDENAVGPCHNDVRNKSHMVIGNKLPCCYTPQSAPGRPAVSSTRTARPSTVGKAAGAEASVVFPVSVRVHHRLSGADGIVSPATRHLLRTPSPRIWLGPGADY